MLSRLKIKYLDWRVIAHGLEIYDEILKTALSLVECGYTHYSMSALACVIRYHRRIKAGTDEDGWKISNTHKAYLARELLATGLLPNGFFTIKKLKYED